MNALANYDLHEDVAVVTMDNPPVNGLSAGLRTAIVDALDRGLADEAVRAIVITGTMRAFSAGADVTEFGTPSASKSPVLRTVIEAIEQSYKPVIAAISGSCLGGGLELALGCHFRVADAQASLGLPEVKLGLLPGAGGTQRLPRLIGLEAALELIVSGRSESAIRYQDTPLIDLVVEHDLLQRAIEFARSIAVENRPLRRSSEQVVRDPSAEAFLKFAHNQVAAGSKGLPAPAKCVEAIAASVLKPFDEGMRLERESFLTLMQTSESRALRHAFAAERQAAKVHGLPVDVRPRAINKVGVVGAGTMGGGIAMALANAGIPVVLMDASQSGLAKGIEKIVDNYESSQKKGKLTSVQTTERLALISPTLDYAALGDVDLVIEAVFEDLTVKRDVFRALDSVVKTGAVLASNTSALNLDEIAAFTHRPQEVVGLHFFSPANVMRLLEVVRGAKTAPDVVATAMALARRIGKVGVVAGVCDGFIGNRMIARYVEAANDLLVLGASPRQIDGALQAFGFAMGPFQMGDLAGLDIGWASRKRRAAANPGKDMRVAADLVCEAGRFGQKTGAGWYRYETGKRDPIADPIIDDLIAKFRVQKGVTPRQVSDADVVQRCVFALVNEGARILEEGIAARASDIDVVYLAGYGFPPHRGGPMHYAEEIGLASVVRALRRIAGESGVNSTFWTPAPLLVRLAAEGQRFQ
jgi:3-hydroxyacyl-CoA dehydrogenase